METVEVILPHGIAVEGNWYRTAVLHPLTGRDEAFMLETAPALLPAHRTTALLSRALARLGPVEPVTPELVRTLTLGDREALLLHMRRLTLGERLSCILSCPIVACREKMDLDLNVSHLLLPPYAHEKAVHEHVIEGDTGRYRVRFRLPNGADQEAAAVLALECIEGAATLVLQRCIKHVSAPDDAGQLVHDIPASVAQALPHVLSELDPQAEVRLALTCPACGVTFNQVFDTGDYFVRELFGRRHSLYREVHVLALHYHWSEADIMAMTRQKRRLYLGLLAEAVHTESVS